MPHQGRDTGTTTVIRSRNVDQLVEGVSTTDGAGVKLTRVLSEALHQRLDPFLMLDAFRSENPSDYIAGFPEHPHRGFETVTYMLAGRMRHRDSLGNEGLLLGGDIQWLTAGRGVIHSEMPEQENGLLEGFQLWINLPARDKLCEPAYRDIAHQDLPRIARPGVTVVVIAGSFGEVGGLVHREATSPTYLDVHLQAGARVAVPLPSEHNAFLYLYRGSLNVAGRSIQQGHMAILANDLRADGVVLEAPTAARALLIAGRPLGEPIMQYGPIVMNTQGELLQAVADFQSGRFTSP